MLTIDLQHRTALVTGMTSGIGARDALSFVQQVEQEGDRAFYCQADVTRESDLERLVSETARRFGGIDALVSNAGQNVFKGALDCRKEDWCAHWLLNGDPPSGR